VICDLYHMERVLPTGLNAQLMRRGLPASEFCVELSCDRFVPAASNHCDLVHSSRLSRVGTAT
jgi:hypothetical protein